MRRWFLIPSLVLASSVAGCSADKSGGVPPASLGQAIYTNCAACHGHAGEGGFGPPFAGNPNLAKDQQMLGQILNGSPHMPPFREMLSDAEIAAVANHIRGQWLKPAKPPLSGRDVAQARRRIHPGASDDH